MKSYGRAPTFLITTGNEQVRSVVAAIAGGIAWGLVVKWTDNEVLGVAAKTVEEDWTYARAWLHDAISED